MSLKTGKKPKDTKGRHSFPRDKATQKAAREAIIAAVGQGIPIEFACSSAGLSPDTVDEWLRRGRGEDKRRPTKELASFAQAIAKASADSVAIRLLRITRAAQGGAVLAERTTRTTRPDGSVTEDIDKRLSAPQWQADAWVLERTRQDLFALQSKLKAEITGKDGGPLKTESTVTWDLSKLSDEQLAALLTMAEVAGAKAAPDESAGN